MIKKTPANIKTDYFNHYFIRDENDTKRTQKKVMQVTNGNKRFPTFPTMTNMKNISLITEIEFLKTLMNYFALQ